jgi:hypothetical protein
VGDIYDSGVCLPVKYAAAAEGEQRQALAECDIAERPGGADLSAIWNSNSRLNISYPKSWTKATKKF